MTNNSKKKNNICIYPGTFDPVTYGHIGVIQKSSQLADTLIIGVATHTQKSCSFTPEERKDMIIRSLTEQNIQHDNISPMIFDGLLVDFAQQVGASIIIRGIRAVSDFEYEFQMSCVNSKLCNDIITVFVPASDDTQFISSRFVKQIASLGADCHEFVTDYVANKLKLHYNK